MANSGADAGELDARLNAAIAEMQSAFNGACLGTHPIEDAERAIYAVFDAQLEMEIAKRKAQLSILAASSIQELHRRYEETRPTFETIGRLRGLISPNAN
jgi:hypothetical protein